MSTFNTLTNTLGTAVTTIGATYNSVLWSDKMTAYNGKTVSYDSIGSVTSYDGWDYTWSNRQLKQIKNDDTRICYGYDANGLRTLKVVYDLTQSNKSETYRYMWKDGKISFVKYTDWVVTTSKDYYSYIIYDGDEPMGMLVNSYYSYLPIQNNTFLFVKNLQGDVIGIVDENGNTLVTYNYDAWGNVSCTVNSNFAVLGELVKKINPFTYRGYNYDYEIGLYYLQSRYYNPEWGRFISSDIYLETGTGVLGSNVFTYCDNNCVNKTDPEGTWKKDVHLEKTLEWAKHFFYPSDAQTIANANNGMDSITDKKHAVFSSQQRFHFNRNPKDVLDSRKTFALSQLLIAAICWVNAEVNFESRVKNQYAYSRRDFEYYGALQFLGEGLHSLQDYQGHGNIGVDDIYAQHIISSDGRRINKADNVYYSWKSDSNMTELFFDRAQNRYLATKEDTYNYFRAFIMLVSYLRAEMNLPDIPVNKYKRWSVFMK